MNFSPNVFSIYYNCYSLLLIVFLSKILTMPHLTEELTKELITKAEFYGEIRLIKQEIEALRQEMRTLKTELEAKIENEILKLDRKFTILFLILLFAIIFLNKEALEFIAKLFGLIK